jgi:hypothetical protein
MMLFYKYYLMDFLVGMACDRMWRERARVGREEAARAVFIERGEERESRGGRERRSAINVINGGGQ